MTHWENTHSPPSRHEHMPIQESDGRLVCYSCKQVIIHPIISSEDPRLEGAGLMRSGGDQPEPYSPMPHAQLLIMMYNAGCNYYPHYVADIFAENESRGTVSEDMWTRLATK